MRTEQNPTTTTPAPNEALPQPQEDLASLSHLLRWRVATTPQWPAFRFRAAESSLTGGSVDGAWRTWTWQHFGDAVESLAATLVDLGLEPGECVAIAATTSIEWLLGDYAVMHAGGVTTSIYPTSLSKDVEHILTHSHARIALVEGERQLDTLLALRDRLPDLRHVIVFDASAASAAASDAAASVHAPSDAATDTDAPDDEWLLPLDGALSRGRSALARDPAIVTRREGTMSRGATASILYTSGTTGAAKGVVLTHESWLTTLDALGEIDMYGPQDVHLLWLPLSHALGKLLGIGAARGGFLTAVDGDPSRLIDNLADVRPTFMCSVPRMLEKVYAKVHSGAAASPARARLLAWADSTALRVSEMQDRDERIPRALAAQRSIADRLVFGRIRAAMGGRMRFLVCGSAALDPQIARWFGALGLPVLEGYGLTESGAATTLSRLGDIEWGTVGRPLGGAEVRIADDGEVLLRSPSIMTAYYDDPAATEQALVDGWLHTGDIGEMTPAGNLKITDRKKNVFKTANGKFVAPGSIEARFMALCPYAAQFVAVGESRTFVMALIGLDPESLTEWAHQHDVEFTDFASLTRTPQVRDLVAGYVDELNAELNSWEQIKRFVVLQRELSIEAGDLTPSMKLRRRAVEHSFADDIEAQYRPQASTHGEQAR